MGESKSKEGTFFMLEEKNLQFFEMWNRKWRWLDWQLKKLKNNYVLNKSVQIWGAKKILTFEKKRCFAKIPPNLFTIGRARSANFVFLAGIHIREQIIYRDTESRGGRFDTRRGRIHGLLGAMPTREWMGGERKTRINPCLSRGSLQQITRDADANMHINMCKIGLAGDRRYVSWRTCARFSDKLRGKTTTVMWADVC
jgi:hypothetical protein